MPEGILVSDIIAISGHRVYPDPGAFYRGIDSMKAKEYIFGGARGADTDALKYIAKTQPFAIRTVVVPDRVIDQPMVARDAIRIYGQNVLELRNKGPRRYQLRNQFMVNRSTHLRAFYDYRGSGGTYNTIEYAKKIGKPYDIWSIQEFDSEKILAKSKREFHVWIEENKYYKTNLGSIKPIILSYLKEKLHMGASEYLLSIGYPGVNTIEEYYET